MMTSAPDVRRLRLFNQHITGARLETPEDVVRWMGAVQAQEYGHAGWAIGLRTQQVTAEEIDRSLNEGSILRTHVMRPTWHFVSPKDIRWLLTLTGPRVQAGSARRYRNLEISSAVLSLAAKTLVRALEGGVFLTRAELGRSIEEAGIETSTPQRLVHILMWAELEGIICSGPKREKQFTYALLDERVPGGRILEREEAVVELTRRYFRSHGPATVRDFVWWSGLTVADARAGLAALHGEIRSESIDGNSYWFAEETPAQRATASEVHLLPAYDEYTVAYADRRDILLPEHSPRSSTAMLGPVIVIDGYVVGSWRRTPRRGSTVLEVSPFTTLGEEERCGIVASAARYEEFLGNPVVVS